LADRSTVVSSFTIIKGALAAETYGAFRQWDLGVDRETNLDRLKDTALFGGRSANWVRDVRFVLSRRFDPDGRDRVLVRMAQAEVDLSIWRPALLWHMTRDEFLFRDFLINWLAPRSAEGTYKVRVDDVVPYLEEIEARGHTNRQQPWTTQTRQRVASGLLVMSADLGLLSGGRGSGKEFVSHYLPDEAFLYILHAIADIEPNGADVIRSPEWQMYLYQAAEVEQELLRLHQFRKLHYERAGTIVALSLPFGSAAEYAESLCA
jgi:hypothetical protein